MIAGPLGGLLGVTTCSVYRIEPTTGVPLEPIPDLVPGVFTPFRVTVDLIDSETMSREADVTQHAVQDFLDVTSHVHLQLKRLTVAGVLNASLKTATTGLPGLLNSPAPPDTFARLDLMRVANLERMQQSKLPVMVITPQHQLARCFLTSIQTTWARADGKQTAVALTFAEARIASPLLAAEVAPDYPSQTPGNNSATGGGQAPTQSIEDGRATPDPVPGVAPAFSAGSVA